MWSEVYYMGIMVELLCCDILLFILAETIVGCRPCSVRLL